MATSIIRRRTQLAKTAALQKRMRKTMMRNAPRLFAAARPGALPMPADRKLQAFTPASVLDRYGDTAAGVRAVAMGDNVITMFDSIGEDYWTGGGVTAKKLQRSEEHTSELQSLMRISYAVFCLNTKNCKTNESQKN